MTQILLFLAGSYLLAFACALDTQGADVLQQYFIKVLPVLLSLYLIVYSLGCIK